MFKQPTVRLLYIIQKSDTKPVELLSLITILAWGLLIVIPNVSLGGSAFRILSKLAPEPIWGFIAIAIGLLAVYGLLFNGDTFRLWVLFFKTIFWACLASGTLFGNPMIPGWILYAALSISSGWAFVRLGHSHNEYKVTNE